MDATATATHNPTDHTTPADKKLDQSLTTSGEPAAPQDKTKPSSTNSPEAVTQHPHKRKSKRVSKKSKKPVDPSSSESSSSTSDSDISDDESTSSSSTDDNSTSRKKNKKKAKKKSRKQKPPASSSKKKLGHSSKSSKQVAVESGSDCSDTASSDDESSGANARRSRRSRKARTRSRRHRAYEDDLGIEDDASISQEEQNARLRAQIAAINMNRASSRDNGAGQFISHRLPTVRRTPVGNGAFIESTALHDYNDQLKSKSKKKRQARKRASTLEYKRVDQLWDSSIHNYKLTESAEDQEDAFDQYVFTVRRRFDWENKYKNTVVDIKSKLLKEALQEVMKDVKGVSLVEEQPSIDPNMLFLYLEELRKYARKTLKAKAKAEKKRKIKKKISLTIAQCKVLLGYLDQDYEETKKTLYPMLDAGNITFDLLWALFKPNSIAYTPTYGNAEEPRCFKVDYATKESSFMRGEWYSVEGRYLEYDGKSFGLGDFEAQIDAFKGPRKITSLNTYPLAYHRDPDKLKHLLVERGKKFVALEGMNYRFHKGMAFMKKKRTVAKVNINGRIMVDPNLFRRINPNYPISIIKPKDPEEDYYQSADESSGCGGGSSGEEGKDDEAAEGAQFPTEEKEKEKTRFKFIRDKSDNVHIVQVTVDDNGQEEQIENLDKLPEEVDPKQKREFSEEELLIASPVVLGFAFSEKLWLEFSISGLRGIEWNEGAFDSLVLPANQKSIVKALVESHKFHAAKTIDDVVQGKGKGLVAVLHGPPGTGKTLTAEGIAELLKCPLYMVSAGELGTDPRILEHELQKILDIAHAWGAVLLLDESDVFLEKREVHDIHRNALVSIFLRLLEYFQGILFLTTNRVETFDDAFQSRIHIALRYGELTLKAKRAVWKLFLDKVHLMEISDNDSQMAHSSSEGVASGSSSLDTSSDPSLTPTSSSSPPEPDTRSNFKESDYDSLARRPLNGRQIKNAVRTSQALAVNRKEKLAMRHILEVLEVAESFEQDLRGGTGYREAMRSYT